MIDTSELVEYDPFAPYPEDQKAAIEWLGPYRMDVGCGPNPLPGTKILYDVENWNNPDIVLVDFYTEADSILPLNVYCRHVIEDMRYPEVLFEVFKECERGWIETPHPLVEFQRGVDCYLPWRGFIHHHWFIWVEDDTLMLLPKTPLIEHISDYKTTGAPWNTYYKWDNFDFKYKIFKHDADLDLRDPEAYCKLLERGFNAKAIR